MTIVSHSHRFIYIKCRKVASSSLLVALGQHCSGDDIVTAPGNKEGHGDFTRNEGGIFQTHMHPKDIRRLIGNDIWESYTKITVVRNPWDVGVSSLLWKYHRRHVRGREFSPGFKEALEARSFDLNDEEFRFYMELTLETNRRNSAYCFAPDGTPQADIYLRYETLQDDYNALCDQLKVPQSTLPKLKSKSRPEGLNYRDFYDDSLKQAVYDSAKPIVDYFNYTF